jgi:hypothetical protein
MIDTIKTYIKKYLIRILVILGFLLMIGITFDAIRSCQDYKDRNNNNVVALTDSIKYYKTKYGEVYVSKTLLEGDLNILKIVNDSLYNTIKDMKLNKPTTIVYIDNTIDNGAKDTSWTIPQIPSQIDSVFYPMITKKFDFNNKYRELEGKVTIKDSTMNLNIEKDKVFVDYTLAVENNKVYVKSNNPYVQYNKIQGIELPKPKKRWTTVVIGPSISYGYDFNGKCFGPSINLSLTYGLDLGSIFKK